MRYIVFVLFLALTPFYSYAQETPSNSAPFGLSWGMSTSEARALGVELTDMPNSEWGKSFRAVKLPKMLSDADYVVLSFGFSDKLWRIGVVSRNFENDPKGAGVMARYDELNGILAEKYGKGKSAHGLGKYNEQRYFAMHIRRGEAQWFTTFKAHQLVIHLQIRKRA